jgi:hypothetical protein
MWGLKIATSAFVTDVISDGVNKIATSAFVTDVISDGVKVVCRSL